ncbi:hypothetical protein MGYG_08578 [Nannizzia gypsea CBS 118893]|uniref:Uncharacterized protein n=1 Tax=Arthroderma gypseum (strain ATCC MYA-4604 / CBS 118893) TaxID=535722 RepID=E4V6D9_ARTGP|nr:hypothetical protein MGYG_08578 [Nannizzia gypsea CBS 118893]EFQ96655.1 hypothetical protein MGYG_08578 [Nannizzia gypsea CBS 118893]
MSRSFSPRGLCRLCSRGIASSKNNRRRGGRRRGTGRENVSGVLDVSILKYSPRDIQRIRLERERSATEMSRRKTRAGR